MLDREMHWKHIKNDTPIHSQLNETSVQNLCSEKWCGKHRKPSNTESKREAKIINNNPPKYIAKFDTENDFGGVAVSRRTCQRTLTIQHYSLLVTYIKRIEGNNIVFRWHTKKGTILRGANTPCAPSGPKRIEDALRVDTAARSILEHGVLWSVSACGVWRFMLGAPSVDLAWTWQILADFRQNLVCQLWI